ncbi:MAG TPA: glycosyltransferase family 4 protein, partial [Candidatus Saccharimonadales bacterium]|nr:glycosyltransferase family 4 protein [Candidatus Saccharimonadales bacterium]
MKIMVVTPYFSPKIGGLESYALNLSQELKAQGNEVFIVTSNHLAQKRAEETIQGLRVTRLPVLFNLWNTPVNPLWYFSLRKIIKREKPDIINAHSPVPFMADMAILASGKTHTTLTYHAATLEKDGSTIFSIIAKIYGFLQKPSFRKASSIVAVSQYVK